MKFDILKSPTKTMPLEESAVVVATAVNYTTAICILRSTTGMSAERAQSIIDNNDIANTSGGWYWAQECHDEPVIEKRDEENAG